MCGHDACGRKLLALSSTHGDPVFLENYAATTALTHGDVFYGYEKVSVSIDAQKKLKVTAKMTSDYNHADRACDLQVTPSILDDSASTSTTFTPDAEGKSDYASVSYASSNVYDNSEKIISVTLADPVTDGKSLGYLGVKLDIKLACKNDALEDEDFPVQPVKAQHKFTEDEQNTLVFLGKVTSLTAESDFTQGEKMKVTVGGTAVRQLEADQVRFPEGQWDEFAHAALDKTSVKVQCKTKENGKIAYKMDGWYETPEPLGDIEYGTAQDICANGVCTGRKYEADIAHETTVGFEIPLAKYYETGGTPIISCDDSDSDANPALNASVTLGVRATDGTATCGGVSCKLADISLGLDFQPGDASTDDFGQDLFNGADISVFDNFFKVSQSSATFAWADLDQTFDYQFRIDSTAYECETLACSQNYAAAGTSSSIVERELAGTQGKLIDSETNVASVQARLTGIVSGYQSQTKINRPTLYGQTRAGYQIKQDGGASTSKDIAIRRDSQTIEIVVDAEGKTDGTVKYLNDDADTDVRVQFAGADLGWRSDLGDAAVGTGESIASSADVLLSTISRDGNVFTFFKTREAVTDEKLFDQTVDNSTTTCATDWCKSPQGGDKWLCKKQQATFELTVGKESKDSRHDSTDVVSKYYSVEKYPDPVDPTTQPSAVVYQLAGSTPKDTYTTTATSEHTDTTDALIFSKQSTSVQGFNCHQSDAENVDYLADYKKVCDKTSAPISYTVPHRMVYSTVQVTPDSAASTTSALSEHALQDNENDITFELEASKDNFGMPFDSTLQVEISYEGTLLSTLSVGAECTLKDSDKKAECTLTGFKDANYDATHQLNNGDSCGGAELACPEFSVKLSQKIHVPDVAPVGELVGMFKPAGVTDLPQTCGGAAKRYTIGTRTFTQDVVGKEQVFSQQIQFFNNGYTTPFATIANDDNGVSGNQAAYVSLVPMSSQRPIDNLKGDLSSIQLKMRIFRKDRNVPLKISNVHAVGAGTYEAHICDNPSTFETCEDHEFGSVIKAMDESPTMELALKILTRDGEDPCDGKLLGAKAYDFKFTIQEGSGDPEDYVFNKPVHTYTLPFICHSESNVVVESITVSETTTGWNDRVVEVQLSGSAIDQSKRVEFADGSAVLGAVRLSKSVLTPEIDADDLKARFELDFDPAYSCDGSLEEQQLTLGGALLAGPKVSIECPKEKLAVRLSGADIEDDAVVQPKEIYGDILHFEMLMVGRETSLHGSAVTITSKTSGTQNGIATFVGGQSTKDINDVGSADSDVYIQITAGGAEMVTCNYIEIELSSPTVQGNPAAKTKFSVRCPRQNTATAATDNVELEFGVQSIVVGRAASSITVKEDPEDFTSTIVLGKCGAGNLVEKQSAECDLVDGMVDGKKDYAKSTSQLFNLFNSCDGAISFAGDNIVSTATVARSYSRSDAEEVDKFGAVHFCRETDLKVTVMKTATKSITVAVADPGVDGMEFDVHIIAAEWKGETCPQGEHKLTTTVSMKRKQGENGVWTSADIESYSRSSDTDEGDSFVVFKDSDGIELTSAYADGGATLSAETACMTASDEEHRLTFTMKVHSSSIDYFSAASVAMSVSAPQEEQDAEASSMSDFSDQIVPSKQCKSLQEDTFGDCTEGQDMSPNAFVKLILTIKDAEAAAFSHDISSPRFKNSQTNCNNLFTDCPTLESQLKQDQDGFVLDDTATTSSVEFKLQQFSGMDTEVGWTVTRQVSTARRLRSVEHVSYTLGADGSVSKSTSFAVAPAVRESDGASVITTKEHITDQKLDANGSADGDATVIERTIVEEEKTGEDHTLAILGIVFGGLGSAAAIAVALFVGCASRKDAQGVGSSFSTVSGRFSDRQPLFNRNRFAPSDF